ncbi:MAG: glycosyltransferase family 2 protein [Lachnospiraceae bacterium]|nr:glycosyltransferase family 2 protein [Lachnospiraceae bacterium]
MSAQKKYNIKLSFVIPCYNEEGNVPLMYEAIETALAGKGYRDRVELVFINDGSKDGTRAALRRIHAEKQDRLHIKVVDFSRNFGKEAALYAGLSNAVGEYVTIIDADLQQRPETALEMVDFLDEHPEYDCVAAFQQKRHEGKVLTFFKDCFYKVINRLTDITFVQGASDFRTMRRCVVDSILSMKEYFRFSKGIFSWVGYETYYMPYEAQARATGTTKWSFKKLFKYAISGIVSFTTAPLRFATISGVLASFLALVYLVIVLIQKLAFGIDIPGYATLVVLILFIGGIQLLMLGILGEYLSMIYVEGKHRPIYVAREVLGYEEEGQDADGAYLQSRHATEEEKNGNP